MAGIGPRAVALSQHGAGLRDLVFNASRKSFAGGVALSLPPPHPTTSKRRPSRGTRHSRWHCCLGPLSSTLRRPARSSVRRLPEVHPAAVCLVTSSTPRPTQLRRTKPAPSRFDDIERACSLTTGSRFSQGDCLRGCAGPLSLGLTPVWPRPISYVVAPHGAAGARTPFPPRSHRTHHQRRHRPWRGYPSAIGGPSRLQANRKLETRALDMSKRPSP